MHIVPVIDLRRGQVVHAVHGARQHYQLLHHSQSIQSEHSNPLQWAREFVAGTGCREVYVADLDALVEGQRSTTTLKTLIDDGIPLMIDAGIRNHRDVQQVQALGARHIVLATETLESTFDYSIFEGEVSLRWTVSVDLFQGKPVHSPASKIGMTTAEHEVEKHVELGCRQFLLLDLSDVGSRNGPSTLRLLESCVHRFPGATFGTGGGIRHRQDLLSCESAGAHFALVATALHTGELTYQEVSEWNYKQSQL